MLVRKVIEYRREAGVADTGAVMRCSSSVCFVSWPAITAAKEGAHAGWEEGLRWPIHVSCAIATRFTLTDNWGDVRVWTL